MFNYMEVVNQDTGHMQVVNELTDELFDNGYRFVQYVPNSQVDILEMDAQREEDTLERMANSANDPCYWVQDNVMASDPIHTAPLEIY